MGDRPDADNSRGNGIDFVRVCGQGLIHRIPAVRALALREGTRSEGEVSRLRGERYLAGGSAASVWSGTCPNREKVGRRWGRSTAREGCARSGAAP